MTRSEAKAFHDELNTTLEAVFAKYHLNVKKNNVSFNEREVKISITTEQLDESGNHKYDAVAETLMRQYLEDVGVKNIPEHIVGAKFKLVGHYDTYTITGFNFRAPTYPVEFESSRGAKYKGKGSNIIFL